MLIKPMIQYTVKFVGTVLGTMFKLAFNLTTGMHVH